jgi:hypothetical protein
MLTSNAYQTKLALFSYILNLKIVFDFVIQKDWSAMNSEALNWGELNTTVAGSRINLRGEIKIKF